MVSNYLSPGVETEKNLLFPLGLREVDFALGWEAGDWAEAELAHFCPDGSAEALGSLNEPPAHLYFSHFWFGYVYRHQAGG